MDERIAVMKKQLIALLILSMLIYSFADAQFENSAKRAKPIPAAKDTSAIVSKPLVTFIELGSVKCVPCRMMQPVMRAIEKNYGDQVKVVFYDVWKEDQQQYAQKYGIRLIPTQVFLDKDGKEIMRHEGFFPEKEIDKLLQSKGVKPKFAE
jgi:thioredoxin 1